MNKDNKNDLLANEAIEIVKLKNELKARRKKGVIRAQNCGNILLKPKD